MPQTSSRSAWTSRLGFILASAGSAVGLGAIWKFPYMAGTNGGSIFMLPTIAFSLTIGLALLIAEMSMGRAARGGRRNGLLKAGRARLVSDRLYFSSHRRIGAGFLFRRGRLVHALLH